MKKKIRNVVTLLFLLALGVGAGLAQQPTTAEGYFKRGNGNAEYQQSAEAIADYTKAIELNPKFAEAYYGRAEVYRRQTKDFYPALNDYTKAFNLDPASAHEFAPVFQKSLVKDMVGVVAELTALIKDEPSADPFLYFARGFFRAASVAGVKPTKQDIDAALDDFNKGIELAPKSDVLYFLRATALADRKETVAAIADYTKAIEFAPTVADYYRQRAIQYRVLAETDEKRAAKSQR
ncbi:MAG: tetratricopeptide repeat protein [Actinomycetota bacterium]